VISHYLFDDNVLIVFKNRIPVINLFTMANAEGTKCHMILGGTPPIVRKEIKEQIEREKGWILVATDGTMGMGVSINNLQTCVSCMVGHSPHIVLQIVGRLLRNHVNKSDFTTVYDIHSNLASFNGASKYDSDNWKHRLAHYKNERYPILPTVVRQF
jgi:superfamily II DNA or RNA helicase